MLNLWVCEPETQEDVADMGDMFCPDQIDKWDPYQTHEMYQQGTSPPQTDLLQEPQIDYSRHLHTVDTSVNPFNGTQVRVVSTGGSVSDSKSKASVSGGHNTGSSSRNFYKRALQQHQNLLHASKSQTVQMCSEDLSDGMQNSVNIGASYNYGYPQGNNQHQVELNQYDSLSQQYDNQSHYSYNHFGSSHENIHYGPIPNCDVQQSNFFNPPLNETYKEYDYRLCSMQMKPVTPVAPVNTFNNQHQCQYNFNEYAASHPASSQHPSNCNETPYEYSNYPQPQPQPNVVQPFQNMMYNNGVGESHGTHAPLQNPLRLSVVPSPALQQQPFVSYNLDLQPKMVPAAVMPPCDFQATSDISHDSTVKEIQEKPKEEGTAPSQGTEDTAEDTSPTSFNEMYQNLCLFYKTYGHTNVPKMKGWYLLGSWVDSLRKRKKFQILKERGVNIASQERQLTYQEIRHLEDINFNWNTVTAKENEAIISVMKNIDKSKTTTPSVKASGESDLICATTSEDGLSLSLSFTAGDGNPKDMNACKIEDIDNSNPQEKPLEPTPSLPTCSESSSKSVDKASKPKKTFANVVSMKNKRGTSEETVSDAKSKRKRTKRFKKNDLVSSKKSDKDPPSDDEDPQVTEQTWTSPFKRLVEFKRIHGNASVPARNLTDPKLGHWVMTQRRQYQLLQKGKPSRMTKERVDLLEGLGFQWSIRTNPVTMWKMRFEELIEYKELNGGCLVPQRYHENPQLGTWVNTQRRHFKLLQEEKRSCMTKERLEKLNAIGFSWSTSGKASSSST